MTQKELAKAAGLSTNFIGYVERGQRAISIKTLERVALALGVTVSVFFESSDGDT